MQGAVDLDGSRGKPGPTAGREEPGSELSLNTASGCGRKLVFLTSGFNPEKTIVDIKRRCLPGGEDAQRFYMTQTIEGARFTLRYFFTTNPASDQTLYRLRGGLFVLDAAYFLGQRALMSFHFSADDLWPARKLALSRLTQELHERFIDEGASGVYSLLRDFSNADRGSGAVHVNRQMHAVMEAVLELAECGPEAPYAGTPALEEPVVEIPACIRRAEEASSQLAELCSSEYAAFAERTDPDLITAKFSCQGDFAASLGPRFWMRKIWARPIVELVTYTRDDHPRKDLRLCFRFREEHGADKELSHVSLEDFIVSAPAIFPLRHRYRLPVDKLQDAVSPYGVDTSFFRRLFRALHESNDDELPRDIRKTPLFRFLTTELAEPRPIGLVAPCRQLLLGLK